MHIVNKSPALTSAAILWHISLGEIKTCVNVRIAIKQIILSILIFLIPLQHICCHVCVQGDCGPVGPAAGLICRQGEKRACSCLHL